MEFPKTLPGESLFSRYVRHMTLLGMSNKEYLQYVFNEPRISIHPYLTVGLTHAANRTAETAIEVYRHQTLGRLFSFYLPHQSENIYASLMSNDGSAVTRACQLVSFKDSISLSLKYCPLCAQEDMHCHGVTFWHRVHQLPGLDACPFHQVWLAHIELPVRPHIQPGLLPHCSDKSEPCSLLSFELAQYANTLLEQISCSHDSFSLENLIRQLRYQGYVTDNQRFRRRNLWLEFFRFIEELNYRCQNLLPKSEKDYRYLSYLLSGRVSQHPFKYILLAFWISKNKVKNVTYKSSDRQAKKIKDFESIEKRSIELLNKGESLNSISRMVGKSRCYLKGLAMRENIEIPTNATIITNEVIDNVLNMAKSGFHRKVIAKRFRISTGSVEQIISSKKGLVKERRRYKYESKRRRYKVQITRAIKSRPFASKQEIKSAYYAAFHWLYVNEKCWLNETLPKPIKPKPKPRVDWKQRDIELSILVRDIMLSTGGMLSRTKLDHLLGGHGWLIKAKKQAANNHGSIR